MGEGRGHVRGGHDGVQEKLLRRCEEGGGREVSLLHLGGRVDQEAHGGGAGGKERLRSRHGGRGRVFGRSHHRTVFPLLRPVLDRPDSALPRPFLRPALWRERRADHLHEGHTEGPGHAPGSLDHLRNAYDNRGAVQLDHNVDSDASCRAGYHHAGADVAFDARREYRHDLHGVHCVRRVRIPFMRAVPLAWARLMGEYVQAIPWFGAFYIAVAFVAVPIALYLCSLLLSFGIFGLILNMVLNVLVVGGTFALMKNFFKVYSAVTGKTIEPALQTCKPEALQNCKSVNVVPDAINVVPDASTTGKGDIES